MCQTNIKNLNYKKEKKKILPFFPPPLLLLLSPFFTLHLIFDF